MENVITEKHQDGVLKITINRPESMNALSQPVMVDLIAGFESAIGDRSIRVIVLSGAGTRAFCAGGDIKAGSKASSDKTDDSPYQMRAGDDHSLVKLFKIVNQINVPIIARINGHALGGGFGLACMADMAVCSRNAKLGSPEAKIGLFPMIILTHMLRLVPLRKLYEMAITGRNWSADEAFENGLLNKVVDTSDELDDAVDELVKAVLANSSTAIRMGKKALRAMEYMNFEQRLEQAQVVINSLSQTEDAKEGMAAFSEKRKPVWTGN